MREKKVSRLVLIIIGAFFLFLLSISFVIVNFYNSIFRMSREQVSESFSNKVSQCKTISGCTLIPGDILIRKYMTQRIQYIDKPLHIFFTHVAFYLGDGKLFEVFGPEKRAEDDVQVLEFSDTDWVNNDIENFVIIRPKNYSWKLDSIKKNLEFIAQGSNYRFGLPSWGPQRVTCADVIFEQLYNKKVIEPKNIPEIVTPDYLFWLAVNDPGDFEIVGFNVQ